MIVLLAEDLRKSLIPASNYTPSCCVIPCLFRLNAQVALTLEEHLCVTIKRLDHESNPTRLEAQEGLRLAR
jgi:hypothetical protein